MDKSNQKPCQCEKTSCACAPNQVARCACGDTCDCDCAPACQCARGCACSDAE